MHHSIRLQGYIDLYNLRYEDQNMYAKGKAARLLLQQTTFFTEVLPDLIIELKEKYKGKTPNVACDGWPIEETHKNVKHRYKMRCIEEIVKARVKDVNASPLEIYKHVVASLEANDGFGTFT